MRSKFRAAAIAAAVVLYAVTSFATPATAQIEGTVAKATQAHDNAVIAESGLAMNDPAARTSSAPLNSFSQLFGHAVAAISSLNPLAAPAESQKSLDELVSTYVAPAALDAQQDCLASAVYFEARGETLEGQLAVAQVVLNRAASGRFPPDVCEVVTQKAQFSFVRAGRIPDANRNCEAWRKAVAIAEVARERLAATIPNTVLWYHATYVAPSWGQRLTETARIGLHIFYS